MKDTGHTVDPLCDGVQHLVLAGHVLLGGDSDTGSRNTHIIHTKVHTQVTNMAMAILAVETHIYKGNKYGDSDTGSRNTCIHKGHKYGDSDAGSRNTHLNKGHKYGDSDLGSRNTHIHKGHQYGDSAIGSRNTHIGHKYGDRYWQ